MEQKLPVLLIFPFDLLAHYLRCLELAKHLRESYTIYFQHSDQYHSFVTIAGFRTFKCRGLDATQVLLKVRVFDFSWINENELGAIVQNQITVIEQYRPQAVLGDTAPTLKMAAEKTDTFCISLMNGYMTKYYANTRKMPSSHPLHKYLQHLPTRILDRLTSVGEKTKFHHIHGPFRNLRRRYRLTQHSSYQDELEGSLNLICDLPELFPQSSLPSSYRWLPPLYHQTQTKNRIDLSSVLDESKKTIFVTMGSSGNWQQILFLNHQAFDNYNIIVAGGTNRVEIRSSITFDFVDVEEVFPHTDLVLCHGGNGTIYQALAHGIPVFCVTSHFEQEWNARAIEATGLGRWLNGQSATEIVQLIEEWSKKKNQQPLSTLRLRLQQMKTDGPRVIREIFRTIDQAAQA